MVWGCWMVTENIRSPFDDGGMLDGDRIFQSPRKRACHMFLKNHWWKLSKKMPQVNLLWQRKNFSCHDYHKGGTQFFLITIQNIPIVGWWLEFFNHPKWHGKDDFFFEKWYYMRPPSFQWLKIFSHHPTYPNHWMPIDRGGGLCYDFEKNNNFMLHFPF